MISADEALQRLIDGNARFQRGEQRFAVAQKDIVAQLAHEQHPYATILGCSDSRVPPELIFDVGVGELFVIRIAGNVFSPEVSGSLQYAGAHLATPLFVVLGHQDCGAVKAALATRFHGVQQRRRIQMVLDHILPALPPHDAQLSESVEVARAVEANVRWTMSQIAQSSEGRAALDQGRLKLVGGVFELATGRVAFL